MAFCQNCGKQIPDEATLCEACAAAQATPAVEPEAATVAAQPAPAAAQPAAPYFQPAYTAPPAPPAAPPYAQPMRIPLSEDQLPPAYKPLGAWKYFLYSLLFSLPLIGFICLIVFACGGTENINLRNYARSHFCAYLVGLVLGIVIVALVVGLGFSAAYETTSIFDMAIALFR